MLRPAWPLRHWRRPGTNVATAIESSPAWIGTTHPFNGLDGLVSAAEALPEPGGMIGPLPDGTVIEVERVSWLYFPQWHETGMRRPEILAAFNAS